MTNIKTIKFYNNFTCKICNHFKLIKKLIENF